MVELGLAVIIPLVVAGIVVPIAIVAACFLCKNCAGYRKLHRDRDDEMLQKKDENAKDEMQIQNEEIYGGQFNQQAATYTQLNGYNTSAGMYGSSSGP